MSLLKREANEIPLIRRLHDHYRLFPSEYPDLCAVCALDPGLVRGNHFDGSLPTRPGVLAAIEEQVRFARRILDTLQPELALLLPTHDSHQPIS